MLPEWLVWWALPPAESYLRRRSPMAPLVPTSGQLPRGSAPYAPLTDRPLTEDELARWQAENPMPEPDEEELERGWREHDTAVGRGAGPEVVDEVALQVAGALAQVTT